MKRLPQQYNAAIVILSITALIGVPLAIARFAPSALPVFSQSPASVTVTPVRMINKDAQVILPGTVEDRKATIISAQISGQVSEVLVTEGQTVKAGQPLASIEGMITSGVESATPGDVLQQAQSSYDNSQQEYNRYQKLFTQGAIARRQLEAAAARMQLAQEALAAAQSNRTTVSIGNPQPGRVSLIAPVGGTVTGLSAASGNTVQTGQQLMVLQNEGEVRVVIHLEQKDLYLVRPGTPVEISSSQSPEQVHGRIEGIYPEIAADRSTFRAHILIDNSGSFLKAGMPVSVSLSTGQGATMSTVPETAVHQEQGASYLYLAVDGKAVRQQVSTGAVSDGFIEITSALPSQYLVITSDVNGLKNGAAISIQ